MDLQQFGEQLQTLRKQAGLSQERLVEALDQRARLDPVEEYRAVDGTLLSRWERAHTQKGRIWKPTRPYMLHLIDLFASQLDLVGAQAWAAQAGYPIRAAELQAWFPAPIAAAVPPPRPRPTLPAEVTGFVGREREILQVQQRLVDPACRLLTITGTMLPPVLW